MNIKTIIIVILTALCVVFILQNTEMVGIEFLAWEITISRIILIPLLLFIGFVSGYIAASIKRRSRK